MAYNANLTTMYETLKHTGHDNLQIKNLSATLCIPDSLILSIDETICPTIYKRFGGKLCIENPGSFTLRKVEVFLLGESNFVYKETDRKRIYLKRSSHQHLFLSKEISLENINCKAPKLILPFSFDIIQDLPDSFHQKTSSNLYKIIANLNFDKEGSNLTQLAVEQPFKVFHKLIAPIPSYRKSIGASDLTTMDDKETKGMSKRISRVLMKIKKNDGCFGKFNCFSSKYGFELDSNEKLN